MIKWNSPVKTKTVKTALTVKQQAVVRKVLDGDKDVSENCGVFNKLFTLGYVEEHTNTSRTKYWYSLTERGIMELEEAIPNHTKFQSGNNKCPKCDGSGYIPEYGHVEKGICFACNGSGRKH